MFGINVKVSENLLVHSNTRDVSLCSGFCAWSFNNLSSCSNITIRSRHYLFRAHSRTIYGRDSLYIVAWQNRIHPFLGKKLKRRNEGLLVPNESYCFGMDVSEIFESNWVLKTEFGGNKPRSGVINISLTCIIIEQQNHMFRASCYTDSKMHATTGQHLWVHVAGLKRA